jgi:cytochrome c oxidase assembly factor CtaG/putative copper export protein
MTSRPGRAVALAAPVAVLTALVCLTVTGQAGTVDPGLPDAGELVRLGLPAARTLQDLAAALTVGLLVLASCVLPPESPADAGLLSGTTARAVRLAAAAAATWVAAAGSALVLTYADVAGLSPRTPGFSSQLGYFLRSFDLGRSLSVSLALAACVCAGALLASRRTTVGWLALLSLAALLPLALAGHAAGSDDHQAAVDSLGLHLLGVSIWVGGLAALVLLAPRLSRSLAVSTRRYSALAGWCFLLVAASGVVNAWVRLGSLSGLATPYGSLVMVKAAALLALGLVGWWHRRTTLPRLESGDPARRDFLRLAAVEVVLMAATMGVAVALSRSAPPVTQDAVGSPSGRIAALLGYPAPPPLSLSRWFTAWYVEPAWAALAAVGLAWYLVAAVRARRDGGGWPGSRTLAWVAGCGTLLWATGGAPGVYGRTQYSSHVVQHMTLTMLVPMLLVMGAPITLAMRTARPRDDGSRGPREWLLLAVQSRTLAGLTRPAVATGLFVASLVLVGSSWVLDLALSTHAGHMLTGAFALGTGYLFAWVLMGRDPGPARPGYGAKALMLLATLAAQVVLAGWLASTSTLLAGEWFTSVTGRTPAELASDQVSGATVAVSLSVVLTVVMAVVVTVQWRGDHPSQPSDPGVGRLDDLVPDELDQPAVAS